MTRRYRRWPSKREMEAHRRRLEREVAAADAAVGTREKLAAEADRPFSPLFLDFLRSLDQMEAAGVDFKYLPSRLTP